MTLKRFEFAQVEPGHLYELARGYIVVSEVPNYPHAMMVAEILAHLGSFRLAIPRAVQTVLDGASSKLLIPEWESERHPDVSVYLTRPTGPKNRTLWRRWIPELVIEVVSEGSRDRDYTEKRDEYWTLGIKEYWIVDAKLQQVLVLTRGRTKWKETTLAPSDTCESRLLPGFQLPCHIIFDKADNDSD